MNLDIIPNGAIKRVHVSQNDIGRTLTFELFNNSTSYTVPSGATVKIQGTKPSGFGFSETCTVSGNTVTVDTTEEMTDEYGYIDTELSISYSDVVIGTSNFVLAVEKNPHPDTTTDGTQVTALTLSARIDALEEDVAELQSGTGLTEDIKQALLDCFEHVAWIDANGQTYYDALEEALYPPANLVSISCVYTQSGTVYDTDTLDSLKSDLVVTAHYDNNTTQTVTSYTLSGTLTEGTSTITVSYGGKTTTFTVAVTHATVQMTVTNDLWLCSTSNSTTTTNENEPYIATLTPNIGWTFSNVTVTMGGVDITSTAYSNGVVSIANVTDDIVIMAEAGYADLTNVAFPYRWYGTSDGTNRRLTLESRTNTLALYTTNPDNYSVNNSGITNAYPVSVPSDAVYITVVNPNGFSRNIAGADASGVSTTSYMSITDNVKTLISDITYSYKRYFGVNITSVNGANPTASSDVSSFKMLFERS